MSTWRDDARCLDTDPEMWFVAGYDSTAYDDLYPGWHRVEMKAPPSLGASGRTEVLWSNRPIGTPDLFSFDAEASA